MAIENAIHDLLDLKADPTYGHTKHGMAYTVIHLVTIIEQVCRLIRAITPETALNRKDSMKYRKALLLDALRKYDTWPDVETDKHECVVNEVCPRDEVELTVGKLQDLVDKACVHNISGIARHIEASGNTYQNMHRVNCVMQDLLGKDVFDSTCLDGLDELFWLRNLLVHTLDWEVQNAFGFVDLVYSWLSHIMSYDRIRREFGAFQFHVGAHHIGAEQYSDAVKVLRQHITNTKHNNIDAVDEYNLVNSYYHLALAHKHLGAVEDARRSLDVAINMIDSALRRGAIRDADDLFVANTARRVCRIGVLSRSLDEDGEWSLLYDLATNLCTDNAIAYMDLTHEFQEAGEAEYAGDCFTRMEEMPKSTLRL